MFQDVVLKLLIHEPDISWRQVGTDVAPWETLKAPNSTKAEGRRFQRAIMGKNWKIGNNQSPLAESSLKISWYLQVKGASLHGPERHGPLTNNPAKHKNAPKIGHTLRGNTNWPQKRWIFALQAAFTPMPWLRWNGKAMRARREFGCNLTLGVTTGGTHKPLGVEHFLWWILTNLLPLLFLEDE